jgi:hypothetical protein
VSYLDIEGLHPAPTEARWSVLEQELLGCFYYAVKRWAPILFKLGARFTILTDHNLKNILQLHKSVVPKIVRSSWRL